MVLQENRQDVLVHVLAQIKLPINVSFRVWDEDDFPAIQRLSSAEGWPTPEKRAQEAFMGWKASWPALVALEDEQVIGFVRALTDGAITLYITELLVTPYTSG